jgi:hypothetical protein
MKTEIWELASEGLYPQPKGPDLPIKNLAFGILLQALRDIVAQSKSGEGRKGSWNPWYRDAVAWFLSEEAAPGSCFWVCEVLNTSPRKLREWLLTYQQSDRKHREELFRNLSRFQIRRGSLIQNQCLADCPQINGNNQAGQQTTDLDL